MKSQSSKRRELREKRLIQGSYLVGRLHSHRNDRIRDVDGFLCGQGKGDYEFQQNPGDWQCLRQPGQGELTMEMSVLVLSVNVSPLAQSIPNRAQMSPA